MREVYLDYAATTPLDPRVKKAMESYWDKEFGNPSSLHKLGRRAKEAVAKARMTISRILNCGPEIFFTSGGTESINLAIFGIVHKYDLAKTKSRTGTRLSLGQKRGHIISTKIEHHAVLKALEELEKEGFEVTYLNVDQYGVINTEDVKKTLRPDTILVSIMYANNEIGTIEPIKEIGKIIKEYRRQKPEIDEKTPFFHSDACQAAGFLGLDVEKLGVDLLVINGSKIYGPKGIGALYIRRGIKIEPLIYGGGQEGGFRSGTENVPGIVGLAKALELAQQEKNKESRRLTGLRDYFINEIKKVVPDAVLNGHPINRLPNNINISIPGIEGEAVVIYLDQKGVFISTGSACSSTSLEPSHVITALGRGKEYASSSLRFSLGGKTIQSDLDYVLKVLPRVVSKLSFSSRQRAFVQTR